MEWKIKILENGKAGFRDPQDEHDRHRGSGRPRKGELGRTRQGCRERHGPTKCRTAPKVWAPVVVCEDYRVSLGKFGACWSRLMNERGQLGSRPLKLRR